MEICLISAFHRYIDEITLYGRYRNVIKRFISEMEEDRIKSICLRGFFNTNIKEKKRTGNFTYGPGFENLIIERVNIEEFSDIQKIVDIGNRTSPESYNFVKFAIWKDGNIY